jgi:hypothetical protein
MRLLFTVLALALAASSAFADPIVMGPFQAAQQMRTERLAALTNSHVAQAPAATPIPTPVPGNKKPLAKAAAQANPVLRLPTPTHRPRPTPRRPCATRP